jgi:hypothetical protein
MLSIIGCSAVEETCRLSIENCNKNRLLIRPTAETR